MSNNSAKPVVKYRLLDSQWFAPIEVGKRANVVTIDDPRLHLKHASWVHTTTVQSYDEVTGTFETKNTIYKLED